MIEWYFIWIPFVYVIPGGIEIKIASDSRNSQRNARNCFQTNFFEYFTIDLRLNVKGKHNIQSSKVRHVDSLYVAFKFSVYDYTVQNTTTGIRHNCLLFYVLETVISRANVRLRVWEKGKDREFVTSKKRSGKQWVIHYLDHPLSKFFGWVIFEEWWGRP